MPKTVTPADRRKNVVLDAANAASCAQALVDMLARPGGIDQADPAEVARLIKATEAATCRIRRNFGKVQAEGAIPAAKTQRVTIIGPNLHDQSKGSFHVHAAGCADIAKQAKRDPAFRDGWTIEAASRTEVGDDIYADMIAEGSMQSGEGAYDCYFAPCVTLPA